MAARPMVNVTPLEGEVGAQTQLPAVFTAPLRADIVQTVHTHLNKNHRQAYAPNRLAGHQTAAESWGTGRAVSRIPRVPGGGTHRAGQAAFGNMCRGGHMFAPNKTWRRWHRRVNVNLKRYATCSALAASAVPALVMARGHKVENIPEVPLVISSDVQSISKAKQAVALLQKVGAFDDVSKAVASRNIRRGKGKMRNRRYVMRKGPLVIYAQDEGIVKAMRNVPGVDTCKVDSLNLLELAPGGHMGRFCIWTQAAFDSLDKIYGTQETESESKKGFKVPRLPMANTDLARIINSDEIQSVVNAPKQPKKGSVLKKNPLKNLGAMLKLNPYSKTIRRMELANADSRSKARAEKLETIRAGKAVSHKTKEMKATGKRFYQGMIADSDYQGEDYEVFAKWLSQGHGEVKDSN